ncbi:hypothetical protein CBL_11412 [Carabus blaptoides fortunei]
MYAFTPAAVSDTNLKPKMSRRPILSRPRTKLYNANYDIGESYYKDAINRLDRKYSGRTLSPARQNPALPQDILDRHERAFTDDDLPSARRRAEQLITEDNVFDSRGARASSGRPLSTSFDIENDFDDEVSNSIRKLRAKTRASKVIDDVDLENTVNNISFNRMINRTDKMLDSVGLNEKTSSRILEDEPMVSSSARRRMLKITSEENGDSRDMTRWSAMKDRDEDTSAAASRAKQTRARLNDLNDEMEALAERQVAREKRAANLRALIAENAEESAATQTAMKSARISMRTEKKSVAF